MEIATSIAPVSSSNYNVWFRSRPGTLNDFLRVIKIPRDFIVGLFVKLFFYQLLLLF